MSDDETPPDFRRRARLTEQLFTVGNLAIFLTLLLCVVVAAVLWELWH